MIASLMLKRASLALRTLTMAAALMTMITPAVAQYGTGMTPPPASTCPPGQTLVGGVCSIVGGTVGAAGDVAGGAVNAAGNVATGAVGAAGSIVGGTLGAILPTAPPPKPATDACGAGRVLYQGGCFPAR